MALLRGCRRAQERDEVAEHVEALRRAPGRHGDFEPCRVGDGLEFGYRPRGPVVVVPLGEDFEAPVSRFCTNVGSLDPSVKLTRLYLGTDARRVSHRERPDSKPSSKSGPSMTGARQPASAKPVSEAPARSTRLRVNRRVMTG